jgi:hypothetical protein
MKLASAVAEAPGEPRRARAARHHHGESDNWEPDAGAGEPVADERRLPSVAALPHRGQSA